MSPFFIATSGHCLFISASCFPYPPLNYNHQSHSHCCPYAAITMPPLKPRICMTHKVCGGQLFLWGFKLVSPFFFSFSPPVLCVCTPSRHTYKHHPCTPLPSPGQAAPPSQGLDNRDHLHPYHVHTCTCPTHSFCMLACNRPHSSAHKETTSVGLPVA